MKNFDDLNIQIDYTFSASLGYSEGGRYVKDARALVYNGEFADNCNNELAGDIEFKLLYLEQAKEDDFDLYELFDMEEYTFRHAQSFYDFKYGDFKKAICKHYNHSIINGNLCIIETMKLLPSYRGYGLGPRLFKDLVFHFKYFASLFILQPYPLQFDSRYEEAKLREGMRMDLFEKNQLRATKKLSAYYETWGLEKIKGIKDLLFYNTEMRNESFDQISLED